MDTHGGFSAYTVTDERVTAAGRGTTVLNTTATHLKLSC